MKITEYGVEEVCYYLARYYSKLGPKKSLYFCFFFFKQKTAYEIGLGIPAEPLFRSSVCRMTFPILASLLVRLVVLLPFQLLRLSLATPSRWTPLALSVFLHCVVALLLTLL